MTDTRFRFADFELDAAERRLSRDGVPIALSGRYLDALALLVGEAGALISKDRFMSEVWRGVPVTDEALTQCVRTLRRVLEDDAARPRFIETVPKHGYRFVAAVTRDVVPEPALAARPDRWRNWLPAGAGAIGGGFAGMAGGLIYSLGGFALASGAGGSAGSALIVLTGLCVALGIVGGAGVSLGLVAAGIAARGAPWASVAGGALGGLIVGAAGRLLGTDAFGLLIGRAPGAITGAGEGLLLGSAVGLAAWLATRGGRSVEPLRGGLAGAVAGGVAGAMMPLFGGRLMAGSLASLTQSFPGSRLRVDAIGALFGEPGFGPVSQSATAAMEGALFGGCTLFALFLARRQLADAGAGPIPATR